MNTDWRTDKTTTDPDISFLTPSQIQRFYQGERRDQAKLTTQVWRWAKGQINRPTRRFLTKTEHTNMNTDRQGKTKHTNMNTRQKDTGKQNTQTHSLISYPHNLLFQAHYLDKKWSYKIGDSLSKYLKETTQKRICFGKELLHPHL